MPVPRTLLEPLEPSSSPLEALELLAAPFDENIQPVLIEQGSQFAVKRGAGRLGQVDSRYPKILLPLPPLASSHGHRTILRHNV